MATMKPKRTRVIALLTDFGDEDYFVGSVKGVILSVNPRACLVDISHRIPAFDIDAAGFVLAAACPYFPPETIFLAVVDPGVGSKRKILLVETSCHFFIAPDNGLLTLALEREKPRRIREISNPRFFLDPPSQTFEARDKMAPVAAWLSLGRSVNVFGPALEGYEKRPCPEPEVKDGEVRGRVLYADKYGNLITNIPVSLLQPLSKASSPRQIRGGWKLLAGKKEIRGYRETYSAAEKGEVFFLCGSLGLVEIAVREGSAREKTGLAPGAPIRIVRRV